MNKSEITKKVSDFIAVGNVSDLQAMWELAMYITEHKAEAYEQWKKTQYMQEAYRLAAYFEIKKSWEKMSETMADKKSKHMALEKYNYVQYEVDYKLYSDLLDRLRERKIEVQSINKIQKQVDGGF